MKGLQTYRIAIFIIFGLLILIAFLVFTFFDRIKKMYDEFSKKENVNPVSREEILNSINAGIASNKTTINKDEIIDTIKEGLLTHSEINAFEYSFVDKHYFEITQSVHNKQKILGIQILDDKNEIVYPSVRITNDLTVIVDMAEENSGTIKIY